jgi:hypothetical protein
VGVQSGVCTQESLAPIASPVALQERFFVLTPSSFARRRARPRRGRRSGLLRRALAPAAEAGTMERRSPRRTRRPTWRRTSSKPGRSAATRGGIADGAWESCAAQLGEAERLDPGGETQELRELREQAEEHAKARMNAPPIPKNDFK